MRNTCQHYDVPYETRTCPKCGKEYQRCPICVGGFLCPDCARELRDRGPAYIAPGRLSDCDDSWFGSDGEYDGPTLEDVS